jgi:spectinomycin phosphotransferase
MLERPDLQESNIIACIQGEYGLHGVQIEFLPIGADPNTAVYRITADDAAPYFLKLRRGVFDETSVTLPQFLHDQGIAQIIAPLTTTGGHLWAQMDAFKVILYPFVEGCNGYEVELSTSNWRDFGAALRCIHGAGLPPALLERIRRETFSGHWREIVRTSLESVENGAWEDPVAAKLAEFLRINRAEVLILVERAEQLAQVLQTQTQQATLCHSDIHAGNLLIDANDAIFIVDWDDPILAPKERDLMFIGGAQGFRGCSAQEEESRFYRGYGPTEIDPCALAYYRYERIIQDIAVYCEQLLQSTEGGSDREQSLHYLMSNFLPDGTIEMAHQAYRRGTIHRCGSLR